SKYSIDDDEDYLDLLCQFKQRIQFKIVLAYIDEYISAQVACKSLSILAQHLLKLVIKLAWQQSQDRIASSIQVHDLIVIAYGSMATQSMHLQSDFDLVFIINQRISNDNHKFIMYWIKRIIYLLSIRTYSGHLYKLDTQLRPNGNSGAAVVSRTNFENYQRNDAWLWEHAALIKSRTVYATEAQTHWYTQLRKEILCRNRTAQSVDQDLQLMADKLQEYNPKGNHQQEFLVLGKILKEAHNKPELIAETPIDKRAVKHKLDQSIQA
ncbi:MAG TPA: hypothetical protein ENJ41_06440, partial [Oceanospirillales bacterium]|nr:hypothetical protein [Oceanospirillales bacterium]